MLVAIELDTIRAAVGDDRFNAMFSSMKNNKPEKGRLKLSQYWNKSSTHSFMTATTDEEAATAAEEAPEKAGHRSVTKGDWYYFYNHPKYLLKHPAGAWQGLNSICMDDTPGEQTYSGFGVGIVTEPEMLDEMARAYNQPRTERDYEDVVKKFAPDEAAAKKAKKKWKDLYKSVSEDVPAEYKEGEGFEKKITAQDILTADEHVIDGTKRKGGFLVGRSKKLMAKEIESARGAKAVAQ